jgi:hypothetical protein
MVITAVKKSKIEHDSGRKCFIYEKQRRPP